MFQKIFMGPEGSIVEEVKKHGHALRDLNWREIVTIVPLLIFIFWIGLYPKPFFDLMGPSVSHLVAALQTAALAMP
jgi:NADH-quinone oxidoreductase subunit M